MVSRASKPHMAIIKQYAGWLTKDTENCKSAEVPHSRRRSNFSRFVGVFMLLHLMVFIFGMMNYGMTVRNRDSSIANLSLIRNLAGSHCWSSFDIWTYVSYCTLGSSGATCRYRAHIVPCLPEPDFYAPPNSA